MKNAVILQIAWRNIWRSPLRSSVLICSVALGVWAGIFIMAFANGLNQQRTESTLLTGMGHVQLHAEGYRQDPQLALFKSREEETKIKALLQNGDWRASSSRLIAEGMAASSKSASGVKLTGVNPAKEGYINRVDDKLINGKWISGDGENKLAMGKKLADKLGLSLGSRLVITTQDADDELISLAFRVEGIFRTGHRAIDEMQVFLDKEVLADALGLPSGSWHEMALLHADAHELERDRLALQEALGKKIEAASWTTLSPELGYADEMMANTLLIFMAIILFALAFGIINNMLMAVLERRRELGMLMAVGMNRIRIFNMVMLETLFISLIGGPLGMALGYITNSFFQNRGMNLSFYSEGLEEYGIDTIIYPMLEAQWYGQLALMVALTALISGLFPAIRALKMNPIETMRTL